MAMLSEWLRAAAKGCDSGVDAELLRKGADELDVLFTRLTTRTDRVQYLEMSIERLADVYGDVVLPRHRPDDPLPITIREWAEVVIRGGK